MQNPDPEFDVIIIGGSYAGLAAGLALGRALRKVLIIDSGTPCNINAAHSHNFITQDGKPPAEIADEARRQVLKYETVSFLNDLVTAVVPVEKTFQINTEKKVFTARRLLFATGLKDTGDMDGFTACWGISVLHCPYCHGYEVKDKKTGVLSNGEPGFELVKLISNWSKDLTLFTNGPAELRDMHRETLTQKGIGIFEKEIQALQHHDGHLHAMRFTDGTELPVEILYAKTEVHQQCNLPASLGCEMTDQGYVWIDEMQQTSVEGVFAAGDNSTPFRAIAGAVAAGTKAGGAINKSLINESF